MLDTLKQELSCAIAYIKEQNLRALNKGDITLFDRANCLVIAEPADSELIVSPDNMLITDMSGNIIEGSGQPAAVLQAHLEIYRSFPGVSAVVHSHSPYATAWAQAGRDIPVYGTGHLDTFADAIPCTRAVTPAEAENGYAVAAGCCIVETFQKKSLRSRCRSGRSALSARCFRLGTRRHGGRPPRRSAGAACHAGLSDGKNQSGYQRYTAKHYAR